jgi:hypothetical protein
MPPVTSITATEYQTQLTQSNSDVNPDDLKRHETALVLLGLAAPNDLSIDNQVNALVTTVAAFYSSNSKNVTIITPDTVPASDQQRDNTITLAHEFVHALQDQQYDLTQFHADHGATYDAELASRSVTEGEAKLYETFVRVAFDGIAQDDVNLPEHFQNSANYAFSLHTSDSPYLISPRIFPYYYGGRYTYYQLKSGGRGAIDGLFAGPPSATLPYIMSEAGLVDTPLLPVTEAAPAPVDGTSLFAEDTLGAWLTYQYLKSIYLATSVPTLSVSGWRGDHLWIYNDGTTQNIAVIWRVRWSSTDQVSNFVNQTNLAGSVVSGLASASRRAFAFNVDAFVVAVSGSFDRPSWETVALSSAKGTSASTGGKTGNDAGTAAAASIEPHRLLITPVPRAP